MKLPSFHLLLPIAFLCGCANTDSTPHNYQLYGDPAKGEFLVDTPTGAVWQYQQTPDGTSGFVRVPVVLRMDQVNTAFDPLHQSSVAPVVYLVNDVLYEVMVSKQAEFLKIHPDAKKVAEVGVRDSSEPITAANAAGNRIVSHDGGKTWIDIQTGKPVGQVSVTAPNGVTYTFADAEQADKFKKLAGIH